MSAGSIFRQLASSARLLVSILCLCSLNAFTQAPEKLVAFSMQRIAGFRLAGKPDQALVELGLLKENLGTAVFQRNHFPYLEGILLQESGQSQAACALFEELQESFPLRENLLLHRIECAPRQARRPLYEAFLKADGHPRYQRVLFQFATWLEEEGELAEAKKRYDQVWRARSDLWREAALRHARIHILQGDKLSAVKDLENLIAQHEKGDVAQQAVLDLEKLQAGQRLDEIRLRKRARIHMNQRDTEPARRILQELLERFPRSLSVPQYLEQMARSYVLDENFKAAIAAYETTYRYAPTDPIGIRSKYLAANSALRMDDFELAKSTYQFVIREHPAGPIAVDARFNLADTYRWLGDLEAAEATAREALKRVGTAERRRFYYFLARLYFEQKRFQESLDQLQHLERYSSRQLPAGVTREEIFYLKGICLQALRQEEPARTAFRAAANRGDGYFSKLAAFEFPALAAREPVQTDQEWLDRLLQPRPLAGADEPAPRPASRRQRVAELLFLGLYDEAASEIRWGGSALFAGVRPDYLLNRAYYGALGGLAEESLSAAELLERTSLSRLPFEQYPRLIQTLLYPRHFSASIEEAARRYGVDPDLMLAVMKQESRFEPEAFSPATARGLMQFMLPTAQQLTAELGLEFSRPAQLFQPDFSIRLGGFYLSKLLNRFAGSPEKALAAYNGGADNAARWAGKLTWPREDLFVANIGFRETKLYVLKVMANYYTYRDLYAAPSVAGVEGQWLTWFQD